MSLTVLADKAAWSSLTVHEIGPMILLETLFQDLQYGARMALRHPGATAVTVFALAIGIGVNTSVFTAYQAMVARRLDARAPGEMVNLALLRSSGTPDYTFSYSDYESYRHSAHCFSGLIAFRMTRMTLSDAGEPHPSAGRHTEFASVFVVSENYFQVLGIGASKGQTFHAVSARDPAAAPAVLISENYWQRRFGGDQAILGKTVYLNGVAVTITGITPHDFVGSGITTAAFWAPAGLEPLFYRDPRWLEDRENRRYRLFGRLAAGVRIGQAKAEMDAIAERVRTLHDPHSAVAEGATVLVWPGSPFPLPLSAYKGLTLAILLTIAAAAIVLTVACANVGSLQLARARSREGELRTRMSLGAGRPRVMRQLLTESALTGLVAGGVAFIVSWALLKVLAGVAANALPAEFGVLVFDITPNAAIFVLVSGVSLAAGMVSGLAPAIESSRTALCSASRASTRGAAGRRVQDVLVTAQVAFSLVLLAAGSVAIRSCIESLRIDPGYERKHVLDVDFQFPDEPGYSPSRKLSLVHELRTRLAGMPGVAAITSARPPSDSRFQTVVIPLGAQRSAERNAGVLLHYGYVEASYFRTLGIPLVLGGSFPQHGVQGEHIVILSESAAKQLWLGENPVGRRLRLGVTDERFHPRAELFATGPEYQVAGIAGDTRGAEFDGSDAKKIYLPLPESRLAAYPILMRTQSDPGALNKETDAAIWSIDPRIVATAATLEELLRQSPLVIVSTIAAAVASSIGLLGLLLACMGIHGTVSYVVSLRTREVGIRMAIGAQKRDVFGLVLRESARPVVAGLMAGITIAAAACYLARGLLYGLNGIDGISIAGVSLLLLAIALAASYSPARRATRVDPIAALRYE